MLRILVVVTCTVLSPLRASVAGDPTFADAVARFEARGLTDRRALFDAYRLGAHEPELPAHLLKWFAACPTFAMQLDVDTLLDQLGERHECLPRWPQAGLRYALPFADESPSPDSVHTVEQVATGEPEIAKRAFVALVIEQTHALSAARTAVWRGFADYETLATAGRSPGWASGLSEPNAFCLEWLRAFAPSILAHAIDAEIARHEDDERFLTYAFGILDLALVLGEARSEPSAQLIELTKRDDNAGRIARNALRDLLTPPPAAKKPSPRRADPERAEDGDEAIATASKSWDAYDFAEYRRKGRPIQMEIDADDPPDIVIQKVGITWGAATTQESDRVELRRRFETAALAIDGFAGNPGHALCEWPKIAVQIELRTKAIIDRAIDVAIDFDSSTYSQVAMCEYLTTCPLSAEQQWRVCTLESLFAVNAPQVLGLFAKQGAGALPRVAELRKQFGQRPDDADSRRPEWRPFDIDTSVFETLLAIAKPCRDERELLGSAIRFGAFDDRLRAAHLVEVYRVEGEEIRAALRDAHDDPDSAVREAVAAAEKVLGP